MEQKQNLINEDTPHPEILAHLQAALQAEIGTSMKVVHILELTPIVSEVALQDPASGNRVFARCYRVPPSKHAVVQGLWREHATTLHAAFKILPQKAQGLKQLGNCLAYIAADVPGVDLETYLELAGPTHPDFAMRICVHLIRTLEKLADLNCHHYQIHPGNITLTPEGRPVLKWAGLAAFEQSLAAALNVGELLDATYAAPEQLDGMPLEPSVDIYQLGLLLFRMVAGRPPFMGHYSAVKEGHKSKPLPNPQAFNKAVTVGFNRILVKALAKTPEQRFKDLAEFKTALAYLQPALERAETTGATDAKALKLKEKDKAKISQLLTECREQFRNGDHQTALRTIDNIFVLVGWHGEAARMHQQIWEAMYGETAKKHYQQAVTAWGARETGKALASLNVALGVMPRYKLANKLQAEIFAALENHKPVLPVAIDTKAYLGKAVEVKGDNAPLATTLWSQVLLLPEPDETQAKSDLGFQKQLAARGLNGLQAELEAAADSEPGPPPIEKTTPAPAPSEEVALGDDFDDIFDAADSEPVSSPPPEPPLEEVLVNPSRDGGKAKTPGSGKKKLLLVGVALAVMLVIALGGLAFKMRADAQQREVEAAAMYSSADEAELSGAWAKALSQWEQLAGEFPNYRDSRDRKEELEAKITTRKYEIDGRIDRAKVQLEAGMIYETDEQGKSALDLLSEALRMEPEHAEATELMNRIRDAELERGNVLFEEGKVEEANELYMNLVRADSLFRDEALEGRISTWMQKEKIEPGLEKLDQALKRKQWDKAREISDGLTEIMVDDGPLLGRWDLLFTTYNEKYNKAKAAGKIADELAALEVMVVVRPEDESLLAERDKLNRDLNLEKITRLEKELERAMAKKNRTRILASARSLLKVESSNEKGKTAINRIQKEIQSEIKAKKDTNLRATLPLYDELIRVNNWKSYRDERSSVRKRLNQFDATVSRLKKNTGQAYAKHQADVDKLLASYPDLVEDSAYQAMTKLSAELSAEADRLGQLLAWEQKVADNVGQSYQSILDALKAQSNFKHAVGKNRTAELMAKYREKIENYDGTVTIVIRGASSLPIKTGGFRSSTSYVELVSAGQTFKTEETKGAGPSYNHLCTLKAKAGAPLVFTVYEQARKNAKPIGTITVGKVPMDKKNLVLKPESGDWSLSIDVRRER